MRILLLLLLPLSIFAYKKSTRAQAPACQVSCGIATEVSGKIFTSSDHGQTWLDNSRGLPAYLDINQVLSKHGETFIAGGSQELYHSTDLRSGIWEQEYVGDMYADAAGTLPGRFFMDLAYCPSGVYASLSEEGGLYRRLPGLSTWQAIDQNLSEKVVFTIAEAGNGTLIVGGREGIYTSTDGGDHWSQALKTPFVVSLLTAGNVALCYSFEGLYRSADFGASWTLVLPEKRKGYQLQQDGDQMVAVSMVGGTHAEILVSSDQGANWTTSDIHHFPAEEISDLIQNGGVLFCSHKGGISRSEDKGKTWQLVLPFSSTIPNTALRFSHNGQALIATLARSGC